MQDQSRQTAMFPQPIKPSQFPEQEQLKCPRCDSPNTKFCYYNNYNLLQPRHFCKSCKRYWTKGGSLRNIPIGGGTRKATKRSSSSSSSGLKHRPSSTETLASSVAENNGEMGQGSLMVDVNAGSFCSMLASSNDEQFGSIMEEGMGNNGGNNNQESYMSLQNGDWNNGGSSGWPDLAIYTPGSTFQ